MNINGKKRALELSIVTTLYNSAEYIEEFYTRVKKAAQKQFNEIEFIFVNDGSPDDSVEIVRSLQKDHPNITLVDLSRNFGHHKALMTGLKYSSGELVFLLDSDLEEPPELLEDFVNIMSSDTNLDMVYGVQERRRGNLYEKYSGLLYYKFVNALCDVKIPKNAITMRLMKKKYVDELVQYKERVLNFLTMVALTGFNTKSILVDKSSHSKSTYNLSRKLIILINSITSASSKPLWYIFVFGMIVTLMSITYITKVLVSMLYFGNAVEGWTSIIMSVWFFGGVITMSIGVVGIYLSTVFIEVKQRPYVNIKNIVKS